MKIKILNDVKKYVITSTIKKEQLELVKKYRPDALVLKDAEGNDVFGMSYVEGRPCVSKNGVTFGSVNDAGYLLVTGDIPADLPKGVADNKNYVADIVGAAQANIKALETSLPEVIEQIGAARSEIINGIETV